MKGLLDKPGALFSLEEIAEAIRRAQLVIEALTQSPVIKREVEEQKLLGFEMIKLEFFPARDALVEGQKQDLISHLGLMYPTLPQSNYKITYTVGYEATAFPMIIVSAVQNLVRYRLIEDKEAKASALYEIQVLRVHHLEKVKERENG